MDLQEHLDRLRRQRLVVTSPKIEPAERLVERQQAPRPLQPVPANRRPHWRYKTAENTRKKAKDLTRDQRLEGPTARVRCPDRPETYTTTTEWLPISPDLNPVENVWASVKNWLELNYNVRNSESRELKEALLRAWEAVPDDRLMSLAMSMPNRMMDARNNGGREQDY
ncbi:hypothetical protein F5Y00DRAFT_263654 [Daldinia vernicosa]|uniref:uncharacterized protein n=1 Tax=Daldinia vernicosa TaxID=114800 RepID=UPI00200880CE|nr:uncharacterized protein F5Y00DRAFT_263654 [Daldinia vernicosa]KAI0847291.1 hypothetical protein F5Y00DRAFT_263654 [Daldinia vernicosa]